jgi:4'-phosphopantetheinyl transferase
VVARTLQAAAAALGVRVSDDVGHLCPRCGSDRHGRPFVHGLDDLDVSISRSRGMSLVALATGARIGVDVEAVDDGRFGEVADVLLHAQEQVAGPHEAALTWVRKEALLKALGAGLCVDPRSVWLSGAQEPPSVIAWPLSYAGTAATLVDLRLPTGLVGCLAVLAEEEPDVRLLVEAAAAPSC